MVVLVVILFLQTWRASLIPLLAVPVSIVGSFAVLLMLGFSINTLTLFAMALAIGIAIADSFVLPVREVRPNLLFGAGQVDNIRIACEQNEAELVVVIGRGGRNIPAEDAMSRIAGYSVGQDISDRRQQFADRPPQFCLGKSAANFGPIGPSVVSTDAFENPNDLAVKCELNGQVVQSSSTANLIFSVSELVEFLSKWCELMPGDLIFTGTPAGVGSLRNPRRYLQDGDVLTTMIDGLGVLKNRCVSATGAT